MLGAVSPESFDTLHSYSNTFQMPFVTPWFPEKVSYVFIKSSKSGLNPFLYNICIDFATFSGENLSSLGVLKARLEEA